uniref:Uncharacterized protein n=1 Tax=Anguilla anguilla TaxID=7936 RepID=A0A0E9QVV0_ANGAN
MVNIPYQGGQEHIQSTFCRENS